MTFTITRMYRDGHPPETIKTGLTLEEAQAHCRHPETSSTTATSPDAIRRTEEHGPWFDGYESEDER